MTSINHQEHDSRHDHNVTPGGHEESTLGPGPWDQINQHDPPDVPKETKVPWGTGNPNAIPVAQRSPKDFVGATLTVPTAGGTTGTGGVGPIKVADRQIGRKSVTIIVPTDASSDVFIDSREAVLQSAGGPLGCRIQVGASLTIETEAAVWAVASGAVDSQCSTIVTYG